MKLKNKLSKKEDMRWMRIEHYVGYDWWQKMLHIHGTQEGISRDDDLPLDEHDFEVDWRMEMLLNRIFILTCGRHVRMLPPEERFFDFDRATEWEDVAEALYEYTAETEEELVALVRFLEQTTVWGAFDPDGCNWQVGDDRSAKPRDNYKIWDYYFTEPELIWKVLMGHMPLPMKAVPIGGYR